MRNGYKMLYMPEHHRADSTGCVYEHIVIAEKIIGRELQDKEVVHHIDKNRSNNDPSNLMVFATDNDHKMFHHGAEIYQENNIWHAIPRKKVCPVCQKEYVVNSKTQKYCSNKCFNISNRKITQELEKQLISDLYNSNGCLTAVSKKYNASVTAIVHYLQRANLPYHSGDYKIN